MKRLRDPLRNHPHVWGESSKTEAAKAPPASVRLRFPKTWIDLSANIFKGRLSGRATKKLGDVGIRLRTLLSVPSPLLVPAAHSPSLPRPFLLVLLPPKSSSSLWRFCFSSVRSTRVRGGEGVAEHASATRRFSVITMDKISMAKDLERTK